MSPVGVAVLAAIARELEEHGYGVTFLWDSFARLAVLVNLKQNGFAQAFGNPSPPRYGNSVPFRQDNQANWRPVIDYLTNDWLREDWIDLSPNLRNLVAGTVFEIYANVFEHSYSLLGGFSCGQHYPNKGAISLTVADFGVGIPSNVREFLNRPQMKPAKALEWAFQEGHSTLGKALSRGLGLHLLRSFVH